MCVCVYSKQREGGEIIKTCRKISFYLLFPSFSFLSGSRSLVVESRLVELRTGMNVL